MYSIPIVVAVFLYVRRKRPWRDRRTIKLHAISTVFVAISKIAYYNIRYVKVEKRQEMSVYENINDIA